MTGFNTRLLERIQARGRSKEKRTGASQGKRGNALINSIKTAVLDSRRMIGSTAVERKYSECTADNYSGFIT